MAAALVSAWLGAGAIAAQTEPSQASAFIATRADSESAGASAPKLPDDTSDSDLSRLGGRIHDPDGAALPGVTILLRRQGDGRAFEAVTDEAGRYVIEKLQAGRYELETHLDGFLNETRSDLVLERGRLQTTDVVLLPVSIVEAIWVSSGITISSPPDLREAYEDAELVVAAQVGVSEVIRVEDGAAEVITELRGLQVFKGESPGRRLFYRHWRSADEFDPGNEELTADLRPGNRVLAFLHPSEEKVGLLGKRLFESQDWYWGMLSLKQEALAAYIDRLEGLVAVERAFEESDGDFDPEALIEWLVATAENSFTRGEAIIELSQAYDAISDAVQDEEVDDETKRLGLAFLETHEMRLEKALAESQTLTEGDRKLRSLVKSWNEPAAQSWLIDRLREAKEPPADSFDSVYWLKEFAWERKSEERDTFADSTTKRWEAIEALALESEENGETRSGAERNKLHVELMHEFAEILAGGAH